MATKAFKEQKIAHIKESAQKAKVAIVTNYKGLSVEEITNLRRALQKAGADYTVTKNTLAKIAMKGTDFEVLADSMKESTAIAFGFEDEVSAAKVVYAFAKDHDKLTVKAGIVDGKVTSEKDLKALSTLPNKEGMLSMLLSVLQAPIRNLACAIKAVSEKEN